MTTKLYRVHSTVDNFHGYDGVLITWVVLRDEPPVPYSEAMEGVGEDFEPQGTHGREATAVNELFTLEEAEAWIAYVREHFGDDTAKLSEVELPMASNSIGLSAIPLGGGVGMIEMSRDPEGNPKPDYTFPLAVGGFYDLRRHWEEQAAD